LPDSDQLRLLSGVHDASKSPSPWLERDRKLQTMAHADPLTGCRTGLDADAAGARARQRAGRDRTSVGILFLDLDRFKR